MISAAKIRKDKVSGFHISDSFLLYYDLYIRKNIPFFAGS
ncbi:hypothetical protein PRABACTJOHN_03837 [Parabacteroides johnsonii DSM 18315]|uniref:Uncharacterized protein n=1 Tax=Parabacteroides johnsonii DSM 18315 TaxID=537006 RepID=B7BFK7_9BACT|nr:hypothetical protein PRABACTJOHN_03837 [Parabacteroides johnsonii DSM 18315]